MWPISMKAAQRKIIWPDPGAQGLVVNSYLKIAKELVITGGVSLLRNPQGYRLKKWKIMSSELLAPI